MRRHEHQRVDLHPRLLLGPTDDAKDDPVHLLARSQQLRTVDGLSGDLVDTSWSYVANRTHGDSPQEGHGEIVAPLYDVGQR